ncbi:MAG: hypothetical protein WBA10_08360 [Elainellaceae cyanobacterium]
MQFLALWIGANFFGGTVVGFLENNGLQFAATLILAGAILGVLQWGVLRYAGYPARWWPMASALGWIGGTLVRAFGQDLYYPMAMALWQQFGLWESLWLNVVGDPISVLGMAIAQSLVLRRRGRWTVWLLASLMGGIGLGVVSSGLCAAFCPSLSRTVVGGLYGLGWATYGLVTGIAWRFGMRHDGDGFG